MHGSEHHDLADWVNRGLLLLCAIISTCMSAWSLYLRVVTYTRITFLLEHGYSQHWGVARGVDRAWLMNDQQLTSRDWRVARDDADEEVP